MKHIWPIVLLITVATMPSQAQVKRNGKQLTRAVEALLVELERQMSEALAREDAAVLNRLWSDDLVFTSPNGHMTNKTQRLAGQKPSAQSAQLANINDEVKVRVYGNTAVVTVLSTWKGKAGTQEFSDQYQATHVWVKQRGRWQLVAAHVTPVKK